MDPKIKTDVDQFATAYRDSAIGLNPITGRALHALAKAAGGVEKMTVDESDKDHIECLIRSLHHVGEKSMRIVNVNQQACKLLVSKLKGEMKAIFNPESAPKK